MTLETISLSGTAATRGGSLGRARSDALARWLTGWLGSIARAGVDDPKGHIARMLNETAYLHAIESHAPDLLEEIESMARGAELPLELVLAGQLMDEEWEYRRVALGRPRPGKCTSFAIRDQGSTWIGQNMDLDPFTDGHQLLLTIAATPAEPAALVFTVGGMVALMGVNASGVVVCVNALPDLPGRPEGLPVAFVIRKLLQQSSADAADAWLAGVPHATPQHYLIADPTKICSVEVTMSGFHAAAAADATRIFHTNHALAVEADPISPAYRENSLSRLNALVTRLALGEVTAERATAALASRDDPDHPICRPLRNSSDPAANTTSFTTGAMVCELDPTGTIRSWFSAGPPSERGFAAALLKG